MNTTDTDALTERLRDRLIEQFAHQEPRPEFATVKAVKIAGLVAPIVAVEVRKAKAEAWQEGVNFALPGKETYWISKHNPHRATETGDSDEHR